jgi:hypothetical protein
MLVVQVERFSRVAATVLYLVNICVFFYCFYRISLKIETFFAFKLNLRSEQVGISFSYMFLYV